MKCAIVSSVMSVQKGVGNWTLTRYASSSFVDKIYQQYFPKGELVENDEEASVISETLERQVGAHAKSTVVTKRKCKHGYLQAVVRHPVDIKNGRISSGMIRLTCPHLVKLIDDIESKGGVNNYNEVISNRPDIQSNFARTNEQWRFIKLNVMSKEEKEYVELKLLGKADNFLESGFIGIQGTGTRDVKCLHAHVADELVRDDNEIGKLVLDELKSAGQDTRGCDDCWQQCNARVPKENASWWYESVKNKSKLRMKKRNRRLMKTTNPGSQDM